MLRRRSPSALAPLAAVVVAAALLAGCGAGGSRAETPGVASPIPPWSTVASTDLDGQVENGPADVRFTPDGTLSASWTEGDETVEQSVELPAGNTTALSTAPPPPTAPPASTPSDLATYGSSTAVASNRSGQTIFAWIEYREMGEDNSVHLRATFGEAGKPHGPRMTLREFPAGDLDDETIVAVAITEDGRVAIVSDVSAPTGQPTLVAWTGRDESSLRGPFTVAEGTAVGDVDVAIAPDGRVSVAWTDAPERGGGAPLMVGSSDASGRFTNDHQELTTGEALGGIVADADGSFLVTSATEGAGSDAGAGSAFVRLPRRSRFEARETLPLPASTNGDPSIDPVDVGAPRPAVDPVTGRIAIAYVLAAKTKTDKGRLVVGVRDAPRDLGPDGR